MRNQAWADVVIGVAAALLLSADSADMRSSGTAIVPAVRNFQSVLPVHLSRGITSGTRQGVPAVAMASVSAVYPSALFEMKHSPKKSLICKPDGFSVPTPTARLL